jgi:hypothetical protein
MIRAPNRVVREVIVVLALVLNGLAAHAQAPADDTALVPRGEYLARAADCMPCHTGDKSKPFAGGLPIHTPFGPFFRSTSPRTRRPGSADGFLPISRIRSTTGSVPTGPTSIPRCRSTPIPGSRRTI